MFETTSAPTPASGEFGDVSGVVLAHLLGPVLGDLDTVPDGLAGDAELVDIAAALGRLESWAVAQRVRVLAELHRRTHQELVEHGLERHSDSAGTTAWASHRFDDARLTDRIVSTDVSLAMGVTPWAADRELDLAAQVTLHPPLGVALAGGRIDRRRAEQLLDEIAVLGDQEQRSEIVAAVVGDGTYGSDDPDPAQRPDGLIRPLQRPGSRLVELQPPVLRRAVRHRIDALDPRAAAERETTARAARRVEHRPLPSAMAELRLAGPAVEVGAASATLDQWARAARQGGDPRDLDQLRCDLAIGALTGGTFGLLPTETADASEGVDSGPVGLRAVEAPAAANRRTSGQRPSRPRPPGGRPALIVITMSDRTALDLDDQPATLHGPGGASPLPAEVARRIAYDPEQCTWLGLYTDPRTGIATDISRDYRPPKRMQTYVQLRDGLRSRLPLGTAGRTELDHIRPYDHDHPERGGQTTARDLASLGLREHHLKSDGALTVTGDANGVLTCTTRTGHRYSGWPETWTEPSDEPGSSEERLKPTG